MGESVSNGTLWDTRRPPRGNSALPSMGALLGGPYNTPPIHGTLTLSLLMSYKYIYIELLVKPEILTSYIYRVSQEERTKLRESVPYVKL